jgi:benzoate 4-monooxygenase
MPSTDLVQDGQRFLQWATSSPSNLLYTFIGALALWHIVPFFANTAALSIPGPLAAKFTDFWLVRQAMKGKRFQSVHELHAKHGEYFTVSAGKCLSVLTLPLLLPLLSSHRQIRSDRT